MNYITQALYSFFKPMTSTMRWESTHIFDPQANLQPSLLVSLLESWAKVDPKPASILCDLRVTSIMHAKMPQPPEHEFLLVKTEDRENTSRIFLLERTVDPALVTGPGERPTAMESVKQLCAAMTTSSSSLVSVEEGLPQLDRLTVSTVQAAHVLSDSLENKKGGYQAVDHFLGSSYVYSRGCQGENVRLLEPAKRLSLYQLAIIAKAVQKRFSTYDVLKEQCYFHAGVIYLAVLHHFGSISPNRPTDASNLNHGRLLGLKIKAIDQKDVLQIVEDYKEEYDAAMKGVSN